MTDSEYFEQTEARYAHLDKLRKKLSKDLKGRSYKDGTYVRPEHLAELVRVLCFPEGADSETCVIAAQAITQLQKRIKDLEAASLRPKGHLWRNCLPEDQG